MTQKDLFTEWQEMFKNIAMSKNFGAYQLIEGEAIPTITVPTYTDKNLMGIIAEISITMLSSANESPVALKTPLDIAVDDLTVNVDGQKRFNFTSSTELKMYHALFTEETMREDTLPTFTGVQTQIVTSTCLIPMPCISGKEVTLDWEMGVVTNGYLADVIIVGASLTLRGVYSDNKGSFDWGLDTQVYSLPDGNNYLTNVPQKNLMAIMIMNIGADTYIDDIELILTGKTVIRDKYKYLIHDYDIVTRYSRPAGQMLFKFEGGSFSYTNDSSFEIENIKGSAITPTIGYLWYATSKVNPNPKPSRNPTSPTGPPLNKNQGPAIGPSADTGSLIRSGLFG